MSEMHRILQSSLRALERYLWRSFHPWNSPGRCGAESARDGTGRLEIVRGLGMLEMYRSFKSTWSRSGRDKSGFASQAFWPFCFLTDMKDVRTVEVVALVYQSFFSCLIPQNLPYPFHTQNPLLAAFLPLVRLVTLAAEACIPSMYLVVAGYNERAQLGGHSNWANIEIEVWFEVRRQAETAGGSAVRTEAQRHVHGVRGFRYHIRKAK